jgi:long-chain fatty acid transport protein
MAKPFNFQRLFLLMSTAGIFAITSHSAFAAAFQLWEQDGATVGNYHAGRAAEAADASTGYYNPAGLVRIHNQQLVLGLDPVLTDFQFNGTVDVSTIGLPDTDGPQPASAQGGNFALIPDLSYSTPINDRLTFGLSIVSPFGLKTNYGASAPTRYVTTETSLEVVDLSPSLGFAVNDKLSLGVGFDAEYARAEFDLMAGNPFLNNILDFNFDTTSHNVGTSYAYGYHLGVLYQFSEQTRVGLAYHSKITHHLRGSSKFYGPLANDGLGGLQESDNLKTNATLPATTVLSLFHTLNSAWDIMGTVGYTQWSELSQIVLENTAAISNGVSNNDVTVIIPEQYRNTWNFSVGGNYHLNEQWMFRSGVGFDETPSDNRYRNLQLPDSDRIAVAVGTHYQATKSWGFDFGWTHFFAMNTRINNLSQQVGDQVTVTNGSVQANADVFGLQAKWDIT